MPTDTAITRLLYAMLSQKCLKDIDWNKVAADPILSQEITNGHAARMRYSRFKKQMDGTTTTATRKPRSKNKVSKPSSSSAASTSSKPRKRSSSSMDPETKKLKTESQQQQPLPAIGESFNSQSTSSSARDMQTPDPEPGMHNTHPGSRIVKPEPGILHSQIQTQAQAQVPYQPTTPMTSFSTPNYNRYAQSASPSPNTSFNQEAIYASFGDHGMMDGGGLYGEMLGGEHHQQHGIGMAGFGIGNHGFGGMGGSPEQVHLGFEEGIWGGGVHGQGHVHGHSQEMGESARVREAERVSVKSEPRWD